MLQLHIVAGQMHHDCHFPYEAKSVWAVRPSSQHGGGLVPRLHLQYVHGPMLPFQYAVFKDGLHLQYKRFFPVQFLLDSLAAGDKVRLDAWLGILHNVLSHKIMLAKSTSINGYIYI